MKYFKILSLVILFFCALALCCSIGAVKIDFSKIISFTLTEQEKAILYFIRLPRILLALIVGAALAVSGAAIQSIFRNPLADPSLIGISSGAALAVAFTIVMIGPMTGIFAYYGLSIAAFIGGFLVCLIISYFALASKVFETTYMLLAGIAINSLAGAATGFLTYLSDDVQLRSLVFWTMGGFGSALWPSVIVAFTIIIPAIIILLKYSKDLNILLLGDDEAKYLGVDVKSLKIKVIICAIFAISASVAVSGIIGFVGLVVPHLVRLKFGSNNKILILLSAILGAVLLLFADTISRIIVAPAEMPVGIITSIIGGPFFLWLLIKQNKKRFVL